MSEEQKSIWTKPHRSWRAYLLAGLIIGFGLFIIVFLLMVSLGDQKPVVAAFGIIGVLGTCLVAFILWLCCKRNLFGLACLATLIALFYAEENWRGKHDWEKFKREWEAKGEKFDRHAYVPPTVPEEKNFALTPIVFTSYGQLLTKEGKTIPSEKRNTNFVSRMDIQPSDYSFKEPTNGVGDRVKATLTDFRPWQDYYRRLAATTNLFPVPPQAGAPAADVLLALGKYDGVIEELRQAARLPASRFPLDYEAENPALILLPHLATIKKVTQTLKLRALAEMQNGQAEPALAEIKLMLRLTESLRTEPMLISHLVRIAMLQITLQPVYEGLAQHRWSEAQLAGLEAELARLDFLQDYQLAMRGELTLFLVGTMDYARRNPAALLPVCVLTTDGSRPSGFGDWSAKVLVRLIPSGWFYQNQLRCARMMVNHYIPLADVKEDVFSPTSARLAVSALEAETTHITPYNILERIFLPALDKASRRFGYAQSAVDLARTAIALERYRLAHGEYPEAVPALAPQFIAQVPHDVINGQPLKYRREANGQFVLYSVGWNEKDDGGVAAFKESSPKNVDVEKGDWVWRYPEKD